MYLLAETEPLDRLLSPLELGHATVDSGVSAPFSLYPHDYYEQGARIGTASGDTFGLMTSSMDGLYVPFMTWTEPQASVPSDWQWPCFADQGCGQSHATGYPSMGTDYNGVGFHTGVEFSHAMFNQAMWGQALHPDMLGSVDEPIVIADNPGMLHTAVGPGNAFLDAHPEGLEIRMYATRPPFIATPENPGTPATVVVPQVIVELYSALDANELLASFAIDIIDRDFGIEGLGPRMNVSSAWSAYTRSEVTPLRVPEGCADLPQGGIGGCAGALGSGVRGLFMPTILAKVEAMVDENPTPGIWSGGDAATKTAFATTRPAELGGGYQLGLHGNFIVQ